VTGTLRIHWVAETIANPPSAPPALVEGMLRGGELCVIGAARAVGKSFLVANIAMLVGRGEGLLFGTLPVLQSASVLVANGELRPWQTARRWQMLTGGKDVPEGVAETFDRWKMGVERRKTVTVSAEGPVSREWWEGVLDDRVWATIEAERFGLIIIDAWASFYSGEENSNDQTEAALGRLQELSDATGVAVVIVHHFGKSNEAREPEDLWRGASRLADWANTRVSLLPHFHSQKEAEDKGLKPVEARRYADVHFLRNDEPTDPLVARLGEDGWWSRIGNIEAPKRPALLSVEDVARACEQAGGRWTRLADAKEALGVSRDATASLLDRAVREGALVEEPGPRGARSFRLPASDDSEVSQQVLDLDVERRRRDEGR
jgi:hypothetical protein